MCDYSLHLVASRPAKIGDKLVSTQFSNSVTGGFSEVGKPDVAVCLRPGTEVAFEKNVTYEGVLGIAPFKSRKFAHTSANSLELPPIYRLVSLRERGDAFAHAVAIAPRDGAGVLVHVGRFDCVEFAVVLEPEEPLRTARRAFYAGCTALVDALVMYAPPHKPIEIIWPGTISVDGGLVGGARLAWPTNARESRRPDWIVFGATIRTEATGERRPGALSPVATLEDEGFEDVGSGRLVESFARHLKVTIDMWQDSGFAAVARRYLDQLASWKGVQRSIDRNGDFIIRRVSDGGIERLSLVRALAGRLSETPG